MEISTLELMPHPAVWGVIGNKKLKVTFEIFASKEENNGTHMDT